MSQKDLQKFIQKVNSLKILIDSLDKFPLRKEELASCDTHEQVVELAKDWGFDIGNRWGEY